MIPQSNGRNNYRAASPGSTNQEPAARDERHTYSGESAHAEADFVEGFHPKLVLDAGCGTGRVAIELARRGIAVAGVDIDPERLGKAQAEVPDLEWRLGDLSTIELGRQFDVIVMAGNVMIFLAPGTEGSVLKNMARHLSRRGVLISGFQLAVGYLELHDYDRLAEAAGLHLVRRCSNWQGDPWYPMSTYAVSVHGRVQRREP